MIDIILFIAVVGIFFGGFWCGSKYQTLSAMGQRIKQMFA